MKQQMRRIMIGWSKNSFSAIFFILLPFSSSIMTTAKNKQMIEVKKIGTGSRFEEYAINHVAMSFRFISFTQNVSRKFFNNLQQNCSQGNAIKIIIRVTLACCAVYQIPAQNHILYIFKYVKIIGSVALELVFLKRLRVNRG